MRVVFVNPLGLVGGAEFILLDLLASLPEALPGLDRHLLVADQRGPLAERAEGLGVQTHHLPMPAVIAGLGDSALKGRGRLGAALRLATLAGPAALATRRYLGRLKGLLRELRPDLIHSNGMKMHVLTGLAAPRGLPIVWHAHDFLGQRALMSRLLRQSRRGVARVVAISEAVGRDARAVLPGVEVTVIYNGIDTSVFAPGPGDGPRLDALAGLDPLPGCVRVGLVATYARWKGQDVFLRALARLGADILWRGYIVGGPIYKTRGSQFQVEELKALAGELGVADRVGFVPFQTDTAEIYRALDVVVHAGTRPEPFGRTIAEAMACGRPTIVSRAGGAAELFNDGLDALGTTLGDPAELAGAIETLIGDPARRESLGAHARRSAVEKFSRERLGRQFAAVYREIVGPGR